MSTESNVQNIFSPRFNAKTATMEERRALAEKVKGLRQAAGLTQEELAEKSGVSRRAIIDAESGKAAPQGDKLEAMLLALGHPSVAPAWSDSTHQSMAIIGSLLDALSEERKQREVNAILTQLANAIRDDAASRVVDLKTVDLDEYDLAANRSHRDINADDHTP